jgi:hypothetical protein
MSICASSGEILRMGFTCEALETTSLTNQTLSTRIPTPGHLFSVWSIGESQSYNLESALPHETCPRAPRAS